MSARRLLLEAELFGYEPGAFTGANKDGKDGLFAAAAGGSLFLDEIGEMEKSLQAKLLRVLQERSYRRVGGVQDIFSDARIIASTNRDLRREIEAGRFREDLFYRLNVMNIEVPLMSERPEDIPLLRGVRRRGGQDTFRSRPMKVWGKGGHGILVRVEAPKNGGVAGAEGPRAGIRYSYKALPRINP